MIAIKAHFDGKVFVPDEPIHLPPNQQVNITIEQIEPIESVGHASSSPDRVPGRNRDVIVQMSPDFNDHLGDKFWGIEDEK